jgi:hypothetical protein
MFSFEWIFLPESHDFGLELVVFWTSSPNCSKLLRRSRDSIFIPWSWGTFRSGCEGSEKVGGGLLRRTFESHIDKIRLRVGRSAKINLFTLVQYRYLSSAPHKDEDIPCRTAHKPIGELGRLQLQRWFQKTRQQCAGFYRIEQHLPNQDHESNYPNIEEVHPKG